jgi:subtilisin family serine protease
MTLGYKTAAGRVISLSPITLDAFDNQGTPTLQLSGREYAAMSTARVLRAAQSNFDYPMRGEGGTVRAGRTAVAKDELGKLLKHKEFAVFEDGDTLLTRVVYRELVLRFVADCKRAQSKALLDKFGLTVHSHNAWHKAQVVVKESKRKRSSSQLVELALELADCAEVQFATPNFVSQYQRAATGGSFVVPNPQWHLRVVNARKAWALSAGKTAVRVAVLDDGVDVEHAELRRNIARRPDPNEPRDLLGRDFFLADDHPDHFNPRPKRFRAPFDEMSGNDIHGTPCAGVAVGRGPRGFGLAPRCRLLPVKIFHGDDLAVDSRVADAIRYAGNFADVLSCSWSGPSSPDLETALQDVAISGRAGRGAVVVCATGNDARARVGFPASDPTCIAVGASTDADQLASYSNTGPQVWVVAPSSGGTRGIFCSDVAVAGRGFNIGNSAAGGVDGQFTNDFGGTSSATPLVAGLAALMLSLNKNLSTADVRQHLARSCKKIGPAGAYNAQGFSSQFGHGRIDAEKTLKSVIAGLA